jgi:hypothetical protein
MMAVCVIRIIETHHGSCNMRERIEKNVTLDTARIGKLPESYAAVS